MKRIFIFFQCHLKCQILLLAAELSNFKAVKILIKIFMVILTNCINSTENHPLE
jgi:hypothetical protein